MAEDPTIRYIYQLNVELFMVMFDRSMVIFSNYFKDF